MSAVVLLDAGPLGLVTNPRRSAQSLACAQWLQDLVGGGQRLVLPEIVDYEVRRELLRANKAQGILLRLRSDRQPDEVDAPQISSFAKKVYLQVLRSATFSRVKREES